MIEDKVYMSVYTSFMDRRLPFIFLDLMALTLRARLLDKLVTAPRAVVRREARMARNTEVLLPFKIR